MSLQLCGSFFLCSGLQTRAALSTAGGSHFHFGLRTQAKWSQLSPLEQPHRFLEHWREVFKDFEWAASWKSKGHGKRQSCSLKGRGKNELPKIGVVWGLQNQGFHRSSTISIPLLPWPGLFFCLDTTAKGGDRDLNISTYQQNLSVYHELTAMVNVKPWMPVA